MNSTWTWIIVIAFAIWLFNSDKKGKTTVTATPAKYTQESYVPPSTPRYAAQSFNSYPCTVDCSGHEAGYEWAEENSITDPNDCDGKSNSFIEGCQAYAEEQESDEEESSGNQ